MLLSRSPLSGVRPLRYRAQLVLRVRHESSFSSTTLSPFPPHADLGASALARATRRSLVLRVARSLARSCCAAFARAARALREAHAPFHRRVFLPHPSSIYHLARARPLPLRPIVGSILVARTSILRLASPFAHLDSLFASFAGTQVALSQLHAR